MVLHRRHRVPLLLLIIASSSRFDIEDAMSPQVVVHCNAKLTRPLLGYSQLLFDFIHALPAPSHQVQNEVSGDCVYYYGIHCQVIGGGNARRALEQSMLSWKEGMWSQCNVLAVPLRALPFSGISAKGERPLLRYSVSPPGMLTAAPGLGPPSPLAPQQLPTTNLLKPSQTRVSLFFDQNSNRDEEYGVEVF